MLNEKFSVFEICIMAGNSGMSCTSAQPPNVSAKSTDYGKQRDTEEITDGETHVEKKTESLKQCNEPEDSETIHVIQELNSPSNGKQMKNKAQLTVFSTTKNGKMDKVYLCGRKSVASVDSEDFEVFDDVSIFEVASCIDFGIRDFLCYEGEDDWEVSSDTDTYYLDACPPHRFSDSDFEQIEEMSITLKTALKLSSNSDLSINELPLEEKNVNPLKSLDAPPEDDHEEELDGYSTSEGCADFSPNREFKGLRMSSLYKKGEDGRPKPLRRHISMPTSTFIEILERCKNIQMDGRTPTKKIFLRRDSLLDINKKRNYSFRKIKIPRPIENFDEEEKCSESFDQDLISFNGKGQLSSSISVESEEWVPIISINGQNDEDFSPFTSELERRSIIIRHVRKLVRQDTSGNFAPPDYSI